MSDFLKNALRGAGLAMEDAEVDTDVEVPVEDTPIEEVIEASDVEADPVEEGCDEAEAAAEEAEEAAEGIETSEEVVEALESIYSSMESAMADGGLTAREAGFAQAAIAAQLKRLRVAAPVIMSSESFLSTEDRVGNTTLAMEGVKELGKKIVEAIRAALKALRDAAKNFWLKITDTAGRLEKRATEVGNLLAGKEGEAVYGEFFKDHRNLTKLGQWLSGGTKRKDWDKQAISVVKATHAVMSWTKTVRTGLEQMTEGKEFVFPELDTKAFTDLPCGAKLVKTGTDSFSYKLEVTKTREGASETYDLPPKAVLVTLMRQVAEAAKQLSVYRKDWQTTDAAIEGALKKLEAKGDNAVQKEIQSKFTKAARSALTLPQSWGGFALRALSGYVSLASLVAKHWDKLTGEKK